MFVLMFGKVKNNFKSIKILNDFELFNSFKLELIMT